MNLSSVLVSGVILIVMIFIGYKILVRFSIICAFKGHTFIHLNDTIYFRINYNIVTNEPFCECIFKVCNRCGCAIPTHDYDVSIKPLEM